MSIEPGLARPLIHPTAVIEPGARIGRDVRVGPHCWIGDDVTIGDRTVLGANVVLDGWTTIGTGCTILHGASIGAPPQDLKFQGDRTYVEIGDNNTIREYVTVNRSCIPEATTRIGDGNLLMAYVHVAHECEIQNGTILANAVNLAGHVTIESFASIGGITPIHQFVRIGAYSFIGGGSRIPKDVPPYFLAAGNPIRAGGINVVGLTRRNFSPETRALLQRAYKLLYRSDKNVTQALEAIRSDLPMSPEIERLVHFIETSERGII